MAHLSKILFVCMYNLRNPMAVGFLHKMAKDKFDIHNAWVDSNGFDSHIQEAMEEEDLDIAFLPKRTRKYSEVRPEESFDFVVTICDEDSIDKCPIFPNVNKRLYWNMENLNDIKGTKEEKMRFIRRIRDKIKMKVEVLVQDSSN